MNKPFENYFRFFGLILVLLLLIFDQTLGLVYSLMLFVSWIWYSTDNQHTYVMSRPQRNSLSKILVETGVAYAAFLFISSFLVSFLEPQSAYATGGIQSIFQLLSTSTPILQGSKILTFIGWGILIPVIETTLFFGFIQEGLAETLSGVTRSRFAHNKFSILMFWTIGLVAASFVLFHLTAKNLDPLSLMITGVFAIISGLLVVWQEELRGAIYLHILSNSLVVAKAVGFI